MQKFMKMRGTYDIKEADACRFCVMTLENEPATERLV